MDGRVRIDGRAGTEPRPYWFHINPSCAEEWDLRNARLFLAVSFTPAEKRELYSISQILRTNCTAGRFPAQELLHITLHFFGQTPLDRLNDIEAAMRQAAADSKPFILTTGRAGTFGRGDSAVLWLGIGEGAGELRALQARLEKALEEKGFAPEGREFRAHITLGRDVKISGNSGDIELPKVTLNVSGITLMESTQASGKLEYVPLLIIDFL
jgi:2'-5' RNA ligase